MFAVASAALAMPAMMMGAAAHATTYSAPQIVNAGQTLSLTSDSVTTTGTQATSSALQASGTNAVLNADNVTVSTTGSLVSGAYALGKSRMTFNGGQIQTAGDTAHALSAMDSIITAQGTSLITGGLNAAGARANAGSQIVLNDVAIVTTGPSANGTFAVQGGSIQMTGGSIDASGAGLYSQHAKTQTIADNVRIKAAGNGAHADSGSNIVVKGGTIDAVNIGLYANTVDSVVDLSDASRTTITTTGKNAFGAYALAGTVHLNNDSITTSGTGSHGLYTYNNGRIDAAGTDVTTTNANAVGANATTGIIALKDSTLLTTGANGNGASASKGGLVTMDGGDLTTRGKASHGLFADGLGSKVDLGATAQTHVATIGDGSVGALASNGGKVTLGGDVIETRGLGSVGLSSVGQGTDASASLITAIDSSVKTTGAQAHGTSVTRGGVINLVDSDVLASGAGASALYATGDGVSTESFTTSGGAMNSAQSNAIRAEGSTLNVLADNGAQITGGNGVLLDALVKGATHSSVKLDADRQSKLFGNVQADSASLVDVNLRNGSTLQGAAHGAHDFVIDDTSLWTITSSSDLQDLALAGTAAFAAPAADDFKALVVHGNYAGNNGTLVLNTVLGDDASPTDKLVVEGDTSGNTRLKINGVADTGAYTKNDGIEVVQVGGKSGGAFALSGRVVAGAREYLLAQGGKANPA
ncbi:autotransporter outer membrane beta-barrel domain-containing protein, partial [Dyella japonica]